VKFVHKLKLKSQNEWRAYRRGERKDLPAKPNDIPARPDYIYGKEFLEKGGWGAWLGTGAVAAQRRAFQTYDEAVKFVHKLKLKSESEWRAYYRGERKDLPPRPNDIPTNPDRVYEEFREKGGWAGWLGTGTPPRGRTCQNYDEAVKFLHKLKLKSTKEFY
jgi:hypothetical protein